MSDYAIQPPWAAFGRGQRVGQRGRRGWREAGGERLRMEGERGERRRRGGPWERSGEPGFGPGWGPGFGPGPGGFFGPFGHRGHGGRRGGARRGDVRGAILALLAEEPMHGYQIIQEIGRRSDGVWRPSPGAVYPALNQLEDEGLVRMSEEGGRKVFHLTQTGQAYVESHPDEVNAPWDAVKGSVPSGALDAKALLGQLAMAFVQVMQTGDTDKIERARQVLLETRRGLYRILADDDEAEGGTGSGAEGAT